MRQNRIALDLVVQSGAKRFLDERSRPTSGLAIEAPKYIVLVNWSARVLGINEVDHERFEAGE